MGYARVPSHQTCVPDQTRNRIRLWEPLIEAWAHIDDASLSAASVSTESGPALQGIPFGVKDVIDVAGQPTRFGSAAFSDAAPAGQDAAIVAALRRAGAIPVGKTRTTEFAFVDPTITRNPHDISRSPGGSSSGSAAVVGAGIVPFALGTQTAGSLCRPATYCGVAAYKPGLGTLPVDGMAPLAPSFDAIGVIAASAPWLARIFDSLAAAFDLPSQVPQRGRALRIGLVSSVEQKPAADMQGMMQAVIAALINAGHSVTAVTAPLSFAAVIAHHRTVMLAEAADCVGSRVTGREALLQPRLRAALDEGRHITPRQRGDAIGWLTESRARFWQSLAGFDVLLAYPVPDVAPRGLASTGDQSYLTPWTAMAGPLVSLPAGLNRDGLPLGILLAAPTGQDAALMSIACDIASLLPQPLPARLPGP